MKAIRTFCVALVVASALVSPRSVRADVPIPDTPAGRMLSAWLDAFNTGDPSRMQTFREQHLPPGSDGYMAADFRANTGGFDLQRIDQSDPLSIVFSMKERLSPTVAIGRIAISAPGADRIAEITVRAVPPGAKVIGFRIDGQTRAAIVDGASAQLNELYVFPDTAQKMAVLVRARLKRGIYDRYADGGLFASALTDDLRSVSHDKHLVVNFSPVELPPIPATPAPLPPQAVEQARTQQLRNNCNFQLVERRVGNVGYLKFNQFMDPDVCGPTVVAAMGFLQNVDALIIDLRDNGGGLPLMVQLMASYFFNSVPATHLNDLWDRKSNTTQQYWTLPYVQGKRLTTQPIFVLISGRTASGAEEFAYDLQAQKRATVVGESSWGGAHTVNARRLDDRFIIVVPIQRAINPVTHTNWEGTGVVPDVKVSAADALMTAEKLAAESLARRTSGATGQ